MSAILFFRHLPTEWVLGHSDVNIIRSPEEPGVLLSQAIKPHAMQEKGSAKMHRFANPTRFLGLISAIKPWATGLCLLTFAAGLYFALFVSPPDYQQSESVRIMYGFCTEVAWILFGCRVDSLWILCRCSLVLILPVSVSQGQALEWH